MANDIEKSAGVLLHISSLPSGTIGKDAYRFIDFLASIGASVWQTLPINMPADNSPYQCISTHAGNPDFIDLNLLVDDALIKSDQLTCSRAQIFTIAYQAFMASNKTNDFIAFCKQEDFWLQDFAIYCLLRETFDQHCWNSWPDAYKHRNKKQLDKLVSEHTEQLQVIQFTQYLFFTQWAALKSYAEQHNIKLFGDIPIFVAYDSADVWSQPELFKLDADKEMTVVAGVPPDYFSETGQRWGNPHYNWEAMSAESFQWWLTRIETQSRLFHMIRIDHFRGLEAAWEIPAEEPNAIKGTWKTAPGEALLTQIKKHHPDIELIAEDLGIITDEVNALRLKFDLPGMKILQFAFNGDSQNPYLPENIEPNSITYTGTHDNDTTLGWYQTLNEHDKNHVLQYFSQSEQENKDNQEAELDMPDLLIKAAMGTASKLVIIPMQDILALGTEYRMNTPGTIENNWAWRFEWETLNDAHIQQTTEAIKLGNRNT